MNKLANNLTKHTPEIFAQAVLHGKYYESIALQEFGERSGFKPKDVAFLFKKHNPA